MTDFKLEPPPDWTRSQLDLAFRRINTLQDQLHELAEYLDDYGRYGATLWRDCRKAEAETPSQSVPYETRDGERGTTPAQPREENLAIRSWEVIVCRSDTSWISFSLADWWCPRCNAWNHPRNVRVEPDGTVHVECSSDGCTYGRQRDAHLSNWDHGHPAPITRPNPATKGNPDGKTQDQVQEGTS